MKILITGGSGMLGGNLCKILNDNHEILCIYNAKKGNTGQFNNLKLDICDENELRWVFSNFQPYAVIHTASISNPAIADKTSPKMVNDVNIVATNIIAALCKKNNSRLIYTSTDLVYAGYRGTMLSEDFKLVPISLYAETKLMGEFKIQQTFDNYLILRTALMFGLGGEYSGNHFNETYNKLLRKESMSLFTDQHRTPISFKEAAMIISELIEKGISGEIINLGGKEKVSRYQMGQVLCEEAGLDKGLLIPNSMDDINGIYKVADVSMNTTKLQSYGIDQLEFRESVKRELNT